jgi:hypothetical protein
VAADTPVDVTPGFLENLSSMFGNAVGQLASHDPGRTSRWIVFAVLNFDDRIGDYYTRYIAQIDEHLQANPITGAELVLCLAVDAFERTYTMRTATVVEL